MRRSNPGKREREAKKRHRRGLCWSNSRPAESEPLKLGRKHTLRWIRRGPSVADAERRRADRAKVLRSQPGPQEFPEVAR